MVTILTPMMKSTVALSMVFSNAVFLPAARAQMVRVETDKEMRIKRGGVLVEELVIPKGAVLEVSLKAFNKPEKMKSWSKADGETEDEFVKGIRIVNAPGWSANEVKDANEVGGAAGLFMRKSRIADARYLGLSTPSKQRLEVREDEVLLRNHESDTPAQKAAADKLAAQQLKQQAKEIVEQVDQTNHATRKSSCDRHYDRWLKSGISKRALDNAIKMYDRNPGGAIKNRRYITVVDFTKHSGQRRMFIFDTSTGEVEKLYTSHGHGHKTQPTGRPSKFSGRSGSALTPPGFHVTGGPYHYGKHGKSLVMHGIEARNRHSAGRAILLHKAWYVSDSFVRQYGYSGRSLGCLALDPAKYERVLAQIKGGSLIYNYTGQD